MDVFDIHLKAYTVSNSPIASVHDLSGKTLILLRGYGYGGNIKFFKDKKNNIKTHETASHKSAFQMLKRMPNAYVIDFKLPASDALKAVKIPNIRSYGIDTYGVRFCVSKKRKNAAKIVADLEEALLVLRGTSSLR